MQLEPRIYAGEPQVGYCNSPHDLISMPTNTLQKTLRRMEVFVSTVGKPKEPLVTPMEALLSSLPWYRSCKKSYKNNHKPQKDSPHSGQQQSWSFSASAANFARSTGRVGATSQNVHPFSGRLWLLLTCEDSGVARKLYIQVQTPLEHSLGGAALEWKTTSKAFGLQQTRKGFGLSYYTRLY